ncbi:glycosyltransferase [Streptomyces sp. NBC_01754]|uniref:glycosyltransferase family 2 protein n=1 Tax=Streptomyces sp. NBC_01754 TaxID=2975930 RepID=UPI002DD8235E|nr:glycosyltransferase family 2 protein [Streptomyces sp. NBC_01754]WSC92569.1 glycosyltransferase [Streptomyces sp. NBC_01754]
MPEPDVTVVIGAYNAMPYLTRCLESVVGQSIGLDRLEVVAVDDGSTDETGEELDRLAQKHPDAVRVVHQENSGGPSAPRNKGLELAGGRYVIFVDADDHLNTEALERMLAVADEQGSDVVLGRVAGVNRAAPKRVFTGNLPRADLFESRVWWTLSAHKLFRRKHVLDLGLRFPTHYRIGEDQMFVSRAYLAAEVISVVADYDCYYLVRREDGGNITTSDRDMGRRLAFLKDICALVAEHVEAGPRRDHLLLRQFDVDLRSWAGPRLLELGHDEQLRHLATAKEIIDAWCTQGIIDELPAVLRLRYHLIARKMFEEALELLRFQAEARGRYEIVLDGGTAYAEYPYFRDPDAAVPDSCYDVGRQLKNVHHLAEARLEGTVLRLTGHAYVQRLESTRTTTEVLLRERASSQEHRLPTVHTAGPRVQDDDRTGFTADVDLATAAGGDSLAPGLWDIHLVIRAGDMERRLRLGSRRADTIDSATRPHIAVAAERGPTVFTPYFTKPYGNLTIDVGETTHTLDKRVGAGEIRWAEKGRTLHFLGTLDVAAIPAGLALLRIRNQAGEVHDFDLHASDGRFRAEVPVRTLTTGLWSAHLVLPLADGPRTLSVPRSPDVSAVCWRRGLRHFRASPQDGTDTLALEVSRMSLAGGLRTHPGEH